MHIQNLSGQQLGQYQLQSLLGIGGMGAVYRAYQTNLDRTVAIKVLSSALVMQPGYLERFDREARTAAALEHPHIVPVYDYGTQQGISYVVMRLLSGGTLAQRLDQRVRSDGDLPSLADVASLLQALSRAMDYAHGRGVIHRDIKTSNIMFDEQGTPYLVDFGIARLTADTGSSLTGTNLVMGTPSYMAPEQWRGETLTPATDQYALGVLVYAMLTGRMPFEATAPFVLMNKHMKEAIQPVNHLRDNIPAGVTQVLSTALSKRGSDRYPNVQAFSRAFDQAIQGHKTENTRFFTFKLNTQPINIPSLTPSRPRSDVSQSWTRVNNQPIYRNPVVIALVVMIIVLSGAVIALLGANNRPGEGGQREQIAAVASATTEIPTEPPTDQPTVEMTVPQTPEPTQGQSSVIVVPGTTGTEIGEELVAESTPEATAAVESTVETVTPTASDTAVPVIVVQPTDTPQATSTSTETATASATHTATVTSVSVIVVQPTNTLTATRTMTPTQTPTVTPSWTATVTPSRTKRPTATPTSSPTMTPTTTPSPTATLTLTPSNTPTESFKANIESMTYGSTVVNEITIETGVVLYQFRGKAGHVVDIAMSNRSGDLDPLLILTDREGIVLATNDDAVGFDTRDALINNFVIPEDGVYIILATRYESAQQASLGYTTGRFALKLTEDP